MARVFVQAMALGEKFWKRMRGPVPVPSDDEIHVVRERLWRRISAPDDVSCGCKKVDVQTLREKLSNKLKKAHLS